jgi:hypothetical protein
MYCLCVNVYCHPVTTQLQLIPVSYHIKNRKLLTVKIMRLKAVEAYIYRFRYS